MSNIRLLTRISIRMSASWSKNIISDLLKATEFQSPLLSIRGIKSYMLFRRVGVEFSKIESRGYANKDFSYNFLKKNPDVLSSTILHGYLLLADEEASDPSNHLWAVVDYDNEPENLLLVEVEKSLGIRDGTILQIILAFELSYRKKINKSTKEEIELPDWLKENLKQLHSMPSPMLIISEMGSGKEELINAFLKEKFGSIEAAVFFHPGRLSQAVQLRELFGDPAGVRLGGHSLNIPIIDRSEPVIVIQEAGDLDPLAQLRLLSLFVGQKIDKIWIFETCRDIEQMVYAQRFLKGLKELLMPNMLQIPLLRNSKNFLPSEIFRLLDIFKKQYKRKVELSSTAMEALCKYNWPGNWRELKNTLESAFLMTHDAILHEDDFRLGKWKLPEDWDDLNLRKHSENTEKLLLLKAYSLHAGNQVQMAKALGISRGSLQYKLEKYKLN